MRKRGLSFGVAFVVLLGACGQGTQDPQSRALRISTATQQAQTARFEATIRDVWSGDSSTLTISGAVDFTHDRGYGTMRDGGSKDASEVRWIGATTYRGDRTAGAELGFGPARRWVAIDYGRLASVSFCGNVSTSTTSMLFGISPTTNARPDEVLAQLRRTGATLDGVGHDVVRGTDTTHWRVRTPPPSPQRACSGTGARIWTSRIELWTDAHDRLRRTRMTSTVKLNSGVAEQAIGGDAPPTTEVPTTFTFVTTSDLFDFGVPVDVTVPAPSEVFDETDVLVAFERGNGKVAPRAWRVVAQGQFASQPWTIWYATTTTGWRCYDAQGTPPSAISVTLDATAAGPGQHDPPPKHDGRRADCTPGVDAFEAPLTTYIAGADSQRWTLVGRVDGTVDHVSLRFTDGSSTTVPVDHNSRLVQWSGPVTRVPRVVEAGGRSCRLSAGSTGSCEPTAFPPP